MAQPQQQIHHLGYFHLNYGAPRRRHKSSQDLLVLWLPFQFIRHLSVSVNP